MDWTCAGIQCITDILYAGLGLFHQAADFGDQFTQCLRDPFSLVFYLFIF